MRLDDLVDHSQSETRAALKVRLKGFEYFLGLLRRHATSSIRKTHLPIVSQLLDGHFERATVPHGANRILSKIPKHLFDFVRVGEPPRLGSRKLALNCDARVFHRHA